jgi:hypothetical protein
MVAVEKKPALVKNTPYCYITIVLPFFTPVAEIYLNSRSHKFT